MAAHCRRGRTAPVSSRDEGPQDAANGRCASRAARRRGPAPPFARIYGRDARDCGRPDARRPHRKPPGLFKVPADYEARGDRR